jgi:hypothetical protein
MCLTLWLADLKGRGHLGDLDVDGRLMLQECKGVLFGQYWHFKDVLHPTSRRSLLRCDMRYLLLIWSLLH